MPHMAYQQLPFEKLVDIIRQRRAIRSRNPLFQAMFTRFQNMPSTNRLYRKRIALDHNH